MKRSAHSREFDLWLLRVCGRLGRHALFAALAVQVTALGDEQKPRSPPTRSRPAILLLDMLESDRDIDPTHRQRLETKGCTVVCLVPSRTDTRWWHQHVWDGEKHQPRSGVEIRFIKGRLKFGGSESGAPFPSVVIVFRPQAAA